MKETERYKELYADIYRFHQKYLNVFTDEEWDNCIEEMGALSNKYAHNEFFKDLIVAVASELERQYMTKTKEA